MERLNERTWRDIIWLMVNNLMTRDQIYMIRDKKAYESELRSDEWVFKSWKQGEYK